MLRKQPVVDVNKELLTEAKNLFLKQDFTNSSDIYSYILTQDFNNNEALLMSHLIELTSFNKAYALSLADDFFRKKSLRQDDVYENINDKIDYYFDNKIQTKIHQSDAISYNEFKNSIDNYSDDYELSFYLTHVYMKISFKDEYEIVEFLTTLLDKNLENLAIQYFEKFSHLITNETNIQNISKKLQKSLK
ncbi:MAG: Unknown protein [uncultured Campylobacterales bacterium]|uniref:Uncharacterized protein n=1 Tax=uncultured Campylobacterales bacterium TaxID=352960 RepID=A0A6S6SQI6_9BACT|nr:MAG: Unknown protein [uncultured Campylobacterales bacterium]